MEAFVALCYTADILVNFCTFGVAQYRQGGDLVGSGVEDLSDGHTDRLDLGTNVKTLKKG